MGVAEFRYKMADN